MNSSDKLLSFLVDNVTFLVDNVMFLVDNVKYMYVCIIGS